MGANDGQEGNKYSCCVSCQRSLLGKSKNPPKFSIANGFVIGHLPEVFDDISDIISSMIACIKPFAYLLSFKGGKIKT